jgi:O-antigen/teichoic acid export membrane protein
MKRIGGPVLITFFSLVLPLLMAAWSVPLIIDKLGVVRFGALTLVWGVFGYFSLFDFGIGKALTKRVAESEAGSPESAVAVRVGLWLLLGLGVVAGLVIAASYPLLRDSGLAKGAEGSPEFFRSIIWLALGMPLLLAGTGLRGVLEGLGRFSPPALARVILGITTFGLPVPLLAIWPTLDVLVIGLVAGRALTLVTQGWSCRRLLGMAWRARGTRAEVREILGFGGWMMLSNLVSPVMVYADRFVIAASSVASQLAYYTTPFELVTRLLILPAAVTTVLFPMMAREQGADRHQVAGRLMVRGMLAMLLVLLPVVIAASLFAGDFLTWWLNPEFAALAVAPMVLLCWGVLLNSLAQFPFSYLLSMGMARQIAVLHLLELPAYFIALPWFLERWGILGAAIAWVARVAFDLLALTALSAIMRFSRIRQRDD